jgi:hypothetical protein
MRKNKTRGIALFAALAILAAAAVSCYPIGGFDFASNQARSAPVMTEGARIATIDLGAGVELGRMSLFMDSSGISYVCKKSSGSYSLASYGSDGTQTASVGLGAEDAMAFIDDIGGTDYLCVIRDLSVVGVGEDWRAWTAISYERKLYSLSSLAPVADSAVSFSPASHVDLLGMRGAGEDPAGALLWKPSVGDAEAPLLLLSTSLSACGVSATLSPSGMSELSRFRTHGSSFFMTAICARPSGGYRVFADYSDEAAFEDGVAVLDLGPDLSYAALDTRMPYLSCDFALMEADGGMSLFCGRLEGDRILLLDGDFMVRGYRDVPVTEGSYAQISGLGWTAEGDLRRFTAADISNRASLVIDDYARGGIFLEI